MLFSHPPVSQLTNQRQLIVNEFGFTLFQTTLLGCVDGGVESLCSTPMGGLQLQSDF